MDDVFESKGAGESSFSGDSRSSDSTGDPYSEVADYVRLAQEGDRPAFEALYNNYKTQIFNFIYWSVRNHEVAQDLAQDTFVRAWQGIRGLRDPAKFPGWLFRIAQNKIIDENRRRRTRKMTSLDKMLEDEKGFPLPPSLSHSDEQRIQKDDLFSHVHLALRVLPMPYRGVCVLRYIEGMSVEEISQTLGISLGTVKSRLGRGRQRLLPLLRSILKGHFGTD